MMKKSVLTLIVCGWLVAVPTRRDGGLHVTVLGLRESRVPADKLLVLVRGQIDCELDYIECERIALIGR